jgi:hypothetical protein
MTTATPEIFPNWSLNFKDIVANCYAEFKCSEAYVSQQKK